MKKIYSSFVLSALLLAALPVLSQPAITYTSGNRIFISLEGVPYTFVSSDLLVTYNRQTQQLYCVLNPASLVPA